MVTHNTADLLPGLQVQPVTHSQTDRQSEFKWFSFIKPPGYINIQFFSLFLDFMIITSV